MELSTSCPGEKSLGLSSLPEHDQNNTAMVEDQLTTQAIQKPPRTSKAAVDYFLEHSAEFRALKELRSLGWANPAGDKFFQKQRQVADESNEKTATYLYKLMKAIAVELHRPTDAFNIKRTDNEPHRILDMCMAPGGFLEVALRLNPKSRALAFSLPLSQGGHSVRMPDSARVEQRLLDITMLAADMDAGTIPEGHPDAGNFLPRQFEAHQLFDLVFCDGQVLRTHPRAMYRENREARRLTNTQLALGLEHLRPGGTMIVLLHKFEASDTLNLLRTFNMFSCMKVFKPTGGHAKRSSFYMIATDTQSQHPEAVKAIQRWKAVWKAATFGSDEEYEEVLWTGKPSSEEIIKSFGAEAVELGREIWKIQAEALARAPFIKGQIKGQRGEAIASGSK